MDYKKLSAMKSLLLRAWRERWPDTYWSIQTNHLVIKEESEQSDLADLLLQQSMVGSSPNLLILSYFKHAINTQMIPYTIGFECIMKFEDVTKIYCIKALIEVINTLIPHICSRGQIEDSYRLAITTLLLIRWLVITVQNCVHRIKDEKLSPEYATVITLGCNAFQAIGNNSSLSALLFIVKHDEKEKYEQIANLEMNLKSTISNIQSAHFTVENKTKLEMSVDAISKFGIRSLEPEPILDCSFQPLNVSINILLHLEAILNSTGDIRPFVDQLLTLRKLLGITVAEMLCEILRSCFMGMINSHGGANELKWASFAFLKIPRVFVTLSSSNEYNSDDVYSALSMFLNYTPLLDLTDTTTRFDCFHLLCKELCGKSTDIELITQAQWSSLMERRKEDSEVKTDFLIHPCSTAAPYLMLRAEDTVITLLKNLQADFSHDIEGLCQLTAQMTSGNNFEVLLSASAASSRLQKIAAKLIIFNEFAKQSTGESVKSAQSRAILFDLMFLMLCYVTQNYGLEVCHSNDSELEDTFFIQWASANLPEDNQYKPLDSTIPDENKIESLLTQIQPGGELKYSLTRWNEVCVNIRHAIQEVLYAWEYNLLSQEQVKAILDNVKNKMCCLSICIVAYLCSYINMADHERRQKPIFMLEHMLQSPVIMDEADAVGPNQNFNERMHLMEIILTKLCQDVLPIESVFYKAPPYAIPRLTPIQQVLKETWKDTFRTGSIKDIDLQKFEILLSTGGFNWFCTSLIKEVLTEERVEDLYKGASIIYSLFSLDIDNLTLCLLHNTLPVILNSAKSNKSLISGPRGRMLAKLAVSCMLLLNSTKKRGTSIVVLKNNRKRSRAEVDLEDSDLEEYYRPSKMRKSEFSSPIISPEQEPECSFQSQLGDDNEEKTNNLPTDKLSMATASLMRLFDSIVQGDKVSEKTYFIKVFLEEVLKTGEQLTQYILQFTPPAMVMQLIKLMPGQFDLDILLSISDLNSVQGRKIATQLVCENERLLRSKALKKTSLDVMSY